MVFFEIFFTFLFLVFLFFNLLYMNFLKMELELKLDNYRGDFLAEDMSIGSLYNFLTTFGLTNKDDKNKDLRNLELKSDDLSCDELKEIGVRINNIKDMSFDLLFKQTCDFFKEKYDFDIPSLDSFTKFDNEKDYLKSLALEFKDNSNFFEDLSLENKTSSNLERILDNDELLFKKIANREINLYVLNVDDKNFKGKIILRKKEDLSEVIKYFQEVLDIYKPSKRFLDKISKDLGYKISKKEFREKCFNFNKKVKDSGKDFREFYESELNNLDKNVVKEALIFGKQISKLYFMDSAGLKIISGREKILEINNYILEDFNDFRVKYKCYQNFETVDKSFVHTIIGFDKKNCSSEIRLQDFGSFFDAEFGKESHALKYKSKVFLETLSNIKSNKVLFNRFNRALIAKDLENDNLNGFCKNALFHYK